MNEERYRSIYEYFTKTEKRYKCFKILYKLATLLFVAGYGIMLFFVLIKGNRQEILKSIIVPVVTFLLCTILRYVINRKRPYEVLGITPLIKKDKKGQSFPSRHVVSAVIITMVGFYLNIYVGIMFLVIAFFVSAFRILAGVHYISDVIFGAIFSVVCGIIGLFII